MSEEKLLDEADKYGLFGNEGNYAAAQRVATCVSLDWQYHYQSLVALASVGSIENFMVALMSRIHDIGALGLALVAIVRRIENGETQNAAFVELAKSQNATTRRAAEAALKGYEEIHIGNYPSNLVYRNHLAQGEAI